MLELLVPVSSAFSSSVDKSSISWRSKLKDLSSSGVNSRRGDEKSVSVIVEGVDSVDGGFLLSASVSNEEYSSTGSWSSSSYLLISSSALISILSTLLLRRSRTSPHVML